MPAGRSTAITGDATSRSTTSIVEIVGSTSTPIEISAEISAEPRRDQDEVPPPPGVGDGLPEVLPATLAEVGRERGREAGSDALS